MVVSTNVILKIKGSTGVVRTQIVLWFTLDPINRPIILCNSYNKGIDGGSEYTDIIFL